MIFNSRIITIFFVLKILLLSFMSVAYSDEGFNTWLSTYKKYALKKGVSKQTIEIAFKNVKFLEQVIKYDRKQPEFYEDTETYVSKRATNSRANKANILLKKNIKYL